MKKIFTLGLILLTTISYSQTRLFIDPDFASIGYKHETLAVLPFKTTISLRPNQLESLKEGQLEKMEEDESLVIQQSLYSWFLKRRQQDKCWVDIQDVNTTNALLLKKDINYSNIERYTPLELAEILGVDGVIRGNFETNKPMSDGASIALGLLVGFYGATNKATINMFIHNGSDGQVLVNYNKAVAGSVGSSSDQLINIVMRKVSRRIPYTKPKE